jgi:hypothetical protein
MYQSRVPPLAVVKAFDLFLYCSPRVGTGRVAMVVYQFILQASPEALHWRIVVAVSPARHGCPHTELLDQLLISMSTVLTPTVGMMDQA